MAIGRPYLSIITLTLVDEILQSKNLERLGWLKKKKKQETRSNNMLSTIDSL